tara:strand:+ start:191 stop:1249 length:1059 start_codon:yes stop_codon:yes gene_type:complete
MLTTLSIRQLRCFESATCPIGAGATIFVGDNAQGKTSALEAVCLVMRLQSPRTSSVADCIKFGHREFAVSAEFRQQDLLFGYSKTRRKMRVDGENQGKSGNFLRHTAKVVWMANDDLTLVTGGAESRRRYLDFMGAQLFPTYRAAMRAYDRALRSRNFLLKRDAQPNWRQIDAYTQILVEHGAELTKRRDEMVASLAPIAAGVQREISGKDEKLEIVYQSANGNRLREALDEARSEETRRRSTAAGPHRDDLVLTLNGMSASQFASEGQQRTVALALKLAQARLFQDQSEEAPLLLLDDIFGELDPARRNALMASLPPDAQKLITTTHLDWLDDHLHPDLLYRVENGTLEVI